MIILWCVIAILASGNIFQLVYNNPRLRTDAVPNEETALKIAEAVLTGIYGEDIISSGDSTTEYLDITLDVTFDKSGRAWIVSGVFPEVPEGYLINGTLPEVAIRMRDGKIMSIRFR